MPSRHSSSNIVIVQASSRPSTHLAPRSSGYTSSSSSYARSSVSMDSSSSSRSSTEARFRSGSSDNYYANVREVPSSRGGADMVVVHHKRPSPADKNEPKASDYQYSRSSSSRK